MIMNFDTLAHSRKDPHPPLRRIFLLSGGEKNFFLITSNFLCGGGMDFWNDPISIFIYISVFGIFSILQHLIHTAI
jgi:hypothetical protein